MKRTIGIILVLSIFISICTATAIAASDETIDIEKLFNTISDEQSLALFIISTTDLCKREIITEEQGVEILSTFNYSDLIHRGLLDEENAMTIVTYIVNFKIAKSAEHNSDNQPQAVQTFSQGTFVVGVDLKPGTYDVKCLSVFDKNYSDSINSLGDAYSNFGMEDFANMFGALGDMYDSLSFMSVELINKNGYTDKFIDLKLNETARIILEDGMKIEISDGSAEFTFIR